MLHALGTIFKGKSLLRGNKGRPHRRNDMSVSQEYNSSSARAKFVQHKCFANLRVVNGTIKSFLATWSPIACYKKR